MHAASRVAGGGCRLRAARARARRCSRAVDRCIAVGADADRLRQEPDDALPGRRCSPSAASRRSSSAIRCRTATSRRSASSASRPTRTSTATTRPSRSARSTSRTSTPARIVYAGVDYEAILRAAEAEADVILWDGGNNDFPFYRPDLSVVVADPLRPGDELRYHPGETNVRMADVVVINKIDSAEPEAVDAVRAAIAELNPTRAGRHRAVGADPGRAADRRAARVVVVEDGPTLTHGGMTYGAGVVAARRFGGGGARRSAAGRRRLHPRGARPLPGARAAGARHGLRRRPRSPSWRRRSTRSMPTSSCRRRRST